MTPDTPPSPPNPDVENPTEIVTANVPVYISPAINGDMLNAIEARFPLREQLGEARVAFFSVDDMMSSPELIDRCYEIGGLVVLINPTEAAYNRLTDGFEHPDAMPEFPGNGVLLFAYNRDRKRYTISNEMLILDSTPDDVEAENVESLLAQGAGKPDDENLPDKEENENTEHKHDVEYLGQRLVPFIEWLNDTLSENEVASKTRSLGDGYDPRADISSCYWDYQTQVPVSLHHKLRQLSGSKADYLDADGEIKVSLRIYPLYQFSFNGGDAPGDYYIVEANITAYNQRLWHCDYHTHGAMRDYIIGYYMKQLKVSYELVKPSGDAIPGLRFYSDPVPQNLNESVNYTTSSTFGCNTSVSGGYADKTGKSISLTAGFSASWTNSRSQTLNDVSTTLDSYGSKVSYCYDVHNISNTMQYSKSKNGKGYPTLCRAEMSAPSTWIWKIPYNNAGVEDESEVNMAVRITVNSKYGCYSWYRPKVTPKEHTFDNSGDPAVCTQPICRPDRRRFGVLALRNAGNATVAHIKIWKQDASEGSEPFAEIQSSYNINEVAKIKLPVGTYRITFDTMDPNSGNKITGSWRKQNVVVNMGKDEAASTTEVSTVDAVTI